MDAPALRPQIPPALSDREADIVAHMNADHADAVRLYATRLLGESDGDWRLTGCDAEGVDLRHEGRLARLNFEQPVSDAEAARTELVRLVKKARSVTVTAAPAS